jgi:nucleoid-associated protein YgaU
MVQQFRKSITALAFFLIAGLAWGQPSQGPLAIKPDAPDRYVVVRGDTLWGISQRYTDSPWRWPELWSMNKEQIRNPHLIYPGYVIILDRERARLSIAGGESGAPGVAAEPGVVAEPRTAAVPAGTVKLSPRVRTESLSKQEIPSIPPGIIEPFLTRPLVIEPDGLDKAPTIIATQADRVILAEGNSAYVRGIGKSSEDTWYVYRKGGPLVDPDTNKTLAYEAIYLGTAQVTRSGEPATVVLSSAAQEVGAGDKLVAAGSAVPPNYAPHAPTINLSGRVMTIYGGLGKVGEAGEHSIITINRGKADGLEIGHVLALYSAGGTVRDVTKAARAADANIKLPNERSGLVFVFRVFERVSYALVMNITRPVNTLDVVQTP